MLPFVGRSFPNVTPPGRVPEHLPDPSVSAPFKVKMRRGKKKKTHRPDPPSPFDLVAGSIPGSGTGVSPVKGGSPSVTPSAEGGQVGRIISPGVDDLVARMANYLCIASKEGVSKVEMTLHTDDLHSPFHNTIVRIEHYDTCPCSFNISLENPDATAVALLSAAVPSLCQALKDTLPRFVIRIAPPCHPGSVRNKKKRKPGKRAQPVAE
ncbi:MAG: hypothetical protein OXF02_08055 [Simkaniaceae bacterium]|nr:hypothetical protein [Simkaniaceae bacterium]